MNDVPGVAITEDHACAHCGYNLRGLRSDGKCPECFTLISHSLRGDLLKYADPDWLERLRFGTKLKLWNVLIGIVVGISAAVIVLAGYPQAFFSLLALVGEGLGLWASFIITTQEPRIALSEDPVTWRRVIRICAVVAFLAGVLNGLGKGGQLGAVLPITAQVLSLAGLVTLFGELLYFRRFALRVPDDRLARSTKTVMWGTLICSSLLMILAICSVWLPAAPPGAGSGTMPPTGPAAVPVWAVVVMVTACAATLPSLVFFLWYISLLVKYKEVFTHAAAASRAFRQAEFEAEPEEREREL